MQLKRDFQELVKQWGRFSERSVYVAGNPDAPDIEELQERTDRSARKFGVMRDALAEVAGVTAVEITDLLLRVLEANK